MLDSDFSPQQDRGIGQAAWHRGGRATQSSPQAAMGQCDPESSTAGTQSPRQGQYLSRVHFSHLMAQEAGDKGTVGYPGTVHCSWDAGTRLSRSETTLSRARRSCQRQAGQCFLPLHACPVGVGTVGSDRAVLTGHSAATTSHQVRCQHLLNLEQIKKAKLHVEMAIKVRDPISQPSNATCLHLLRFWLRRAEPEEQELGQAEPTGLCTGEEDLHGTGPLPHHPPPAASPGLGGEEGTQHGQAAGAALQ